MHYTLQFGMEVVLGVTACINRPCHAKKISILKLSTNKHTYKNLTCESRSVRESWSAQVTFPLLLGLTVCVCACVWVWLILQEMLWHLIWQGVAGAALTQHKRKSTSEPDWREDEQHCWPWPQSLNEKSGVKHTNVNSVYSMAELRRSRVFWMDLRVKHPTIVDVKLQLSHSVDYKLHKMDFTQRFLNFWLLKECNYKHRCIWFLFEFQVKFNWNAFISLFCKFKDLKFEQVIFFTIWNSQPWWIE